MFKSFKNISLEKLKFKEQRKKKKNFFLIILKQEKKKLHI